MRSRALAAFTYLEMLLVVALAGLFLVLSVGLARSTHSRPRNRALAQVVAAFLTAQRERARCSGQPVAVVWPGGASGAALSNSCEVFEGWHEPRRVEVLDLRGEFPQSQMFVGRWQTASLTFDQQRPLWGGAGAEEDWDPAAYLPARSQDPALVFLPSGKVTARGLWRLNSSFVIVVGEGLQASADRLQAGRQCATLRISPSGWVDSIGQLWDGQLASPGSAGQAVATAASPPPSGGGPRLLEVLIQPDPSRLRLPVGSDALVSADGFLSLEVRAESPSGQSLMLHWTDSSQRPGAFSSSERRPMHFDTAARRWVGQIHWRPPDQASHGEHFQLLCHVTDEFGREAPRGLVGQVDLQTSNQKARMAFVEVAAAANNEHRLQVVYEDGTGKRELPTRVVTNGAEPPKASWSPDGSRMAYLSRQGGSTRLWTCNADGSGSRSLDASLPGEAVAKDGVHWSPDGTWLAHIRALPSGRHQVFLVHPDGSGALNLNAGSSDDAFVEHIAGSTVNGNMVSRDNSVFSSDGKYLATLQSAHIQLYAMPGSGATPRSVPGWGWHVVWNPVQPWLAFGSQSLKIYDVENSRFFDVPPSPYAAGPGCFSPDGHRYLYGRGGDLFLADINGATHQVSTRGLNITGQMMGWLDEQRFTCCKFAPEQPDLWVYDLGDGSQQNLTHQGIDLMFCGWSNP